MKPKTRKTDSDLKKLVRTLEILSIKENVKIWDTTAALLNKATRRRAKVNLFKIDKYCLESEIALIPGKVLGVGNLTKNIKIAAYNFSESASNKVKNKMTIQRLIQENPKGNKVRLII